MQADQIRSTEAGIDVHLIKPVDMAELENLLRRFQIIVGGSKQSILAGGKA
jgi:hypothetical protein